MHRKLPWILPLTLCFLTLAVTPALATGDIVLSPGDLAPFSTWLTNPVVSTILLILGIAGIVIEVATVGSFGIFGIVGISSFILYFVGNVGAGHAGAGMIALFISGLILLALEILVIPGFGVAGIAGVLAMIISLVFAAPNPASAAISLSIALVIAIVLILFTLKNRKTRHLWSKLILFTKQQTQEGYSSGDSSLSNLLSATGTTSTTLRPAGSATIDGRKVDVVTQGEFISAGAIIEVILVEGQRVVVREKQPS
ncbi:MAG: NfeD family protein [Clostridiales bacterium]